MKKATAIKRLGGSVTAASQALGISYQAVRQWPKNLTERIQWRVKAHLDRKSRKPARGRAA